LKEKGVEFLEPIINETLKSKVYRGLRQAILSGKLKPGQRLAEVEISRWLGVSRSPIRDAMAVLENEGLIVRAEGRVAYVVSLREEDIKDIYEFRLALELFVISLVNDVICNSKLSCFRFKSELS
jgi:DNA-binding GntR family transcriptional regulator